MTRTRGLLLGTLIYAGVTFPLAYTWHLVLFADLYERLRFVTVPEPNVALGFLTILSQGVLLAAVYPRFRGPRGSIGDGIVFGLAVGAFVWSVATVAHVAKHDVVDPGTFVGMEAAYFLVNFLIYGFLMGLVHARRGQPGSFRQLNSLDVPTQPA